MTSASEQMDVFSRAKAAPDTEVAAVPPMRGVSAESYPGMSLAFIRAAGRGFVIVGDALQATPSMPLTIREWGAWMAYFLAKRIPHAYVKSKGLASVPARWPHLFDADWRPGNDEHAADIFESKAARQTRALSDAHRDRMFVTNRLGYDPSRRRNISRAADEPERPPQFIDRDALFEAHDKDMAELKAKRAARA